MATNTVQGLSVSRSESEGNDREVCIEIDGNAGRCSRAGQDVGVE